jgi:hypothetical protein
MGDFREAFKKFFVYLEERKDRALPSTLVTEKTTDTNN